MYLFKGKAGDLLADIEKKMKLPVKSDITVYDIDINKVPCTYCGELESQDEIHVFGDTYICESCYQNMVK